MDDRDFPDTVTGDDEFRRGKTVIVAAIVGIGFGLAAMPFYTVGVFAPHLARAFGWSTSQIMAGLSLTSLIGLFAIIGRLAGGWLLDHIWAPAVAFVILGMPSLSCMILAHGHLDHGTAMAAIVLLGFALGVEYDVVAYITARYFGMRAYSGIYAIFYICFSTGAGIAPLVYGAIRDTDHDFARALWASALILPILAALFMLLGRYPDPQDWPNGEPA